MRRRFMIAPTPILNVDAETVDFVDVDADSVAVAGVAADLGASEKLAKTVAPTYNLSQTNLLGKTPGRYISYSCIVNKKTSSTGKVR